MVFHVYDTFAKNNLCNIRTYSARPKMNLFSQNCRRIELTHWFGSELVGLGRAGSYYLVGFGELGWVGSSS